ncbi:MAG: glycosyltransferase family 9 protein [Candidatus Omnitrophica bacterium]|nr:glycosyltransferase family 9 protein [Candidatus Omnitrophota bacterium]
MKANDCALRRWLIVRQGAIGDTILLSSLIRFIRSAIPSAWIEVMGVYERVELLVGDHMADSALSSERIGMEELWMEHGGVSGDLSQFLGSYDVILYFAGSNRERLRKRLQIRPDMIVRVHPALPDEQAYMHCTDHYISVLHGILPRKETPAPQLDLRQAEILEAQNYLESLGIDRRNALLVGLHVGAGGRAKRAPLRLFTLAVKSLQSQRPIVCLVPQGPADHEIVSRFVKQSGAESIFILNELPLRKLASVLSLLEMFIGNDSGITHMAAAVGRPTLALFSTGNPRIWRPLGKRVRTMIVK